VGMMNGCYCGNNFGDQSVNSMVADSFCLSTGNLQPLGATGYMAI